MIYGFGGRIDNDSNAVTMIDEENRTAETKGYVNGEYVEFTGGGGGGAEPLIVTGHYDSELQAEITDKTCGEITEAILSGRVVIYKFVDDYQNEARMQVHGYNYQDNTPGGGNISVSFAAGTSRTLSASGDAIEGLNAKFMSIS